MINVTGVAAKESSSLWTTAWRPWINRKLMRIAIKGMWNVKAHFTCHYFINYTFQRLTLKRFTMKDRKDEILALGASNKLLGVRAAVQSREFPRNHR